MNPDTNKLKDIVSFFKKELKSHYPENELKAISVIIFESCFNISRQDMAFYPGNRLNESQIVDLLKVIKRLKAYEPVQYITGYTDFLDLKIKVKPPVLIPRPETEELVLWVEQELKENSMATSALLDIGTGSGCIALALKQRLPEIKAAGLDNSRESIVIAKENARYNKLEVAFIEKDILVMSVDDPLIEQHCDVWVSNPPYVRVSEKGRMNENVLRYEPHDALFVDDHQPLIFYDKISALAKKALTAGGMLFFEINEAMGQNIKKLLEKKGFTNIMIKKDIHDKERFVKAEKDQTDLM